MTTQTETRTKESTTTYSPTQAEGFEQHSKDQTDHALLTKSAVAAADELVRIQKPAQKLSVWALVKGVLSEIDSWFSGPPMTEKARITQAIKESEAYRQAQPVLW